MDYEGYLAERKRIIGEAGNLEQVAYALMELQDKYPQFAKVQGI